jgi:hypothetical protein
MTQEQKDIVSIPHIVLDKRKPTQPHKARDEDEKFVDDFAA